MATPIIRLHTHDRLGVVVKQKTIEDWSGRTFGLAVFAAGGHGTPLFETYGLAYAHPADDAASGVVAHIEATAEHMLTIPRGAEVAYTEYAWRITVTPNGGEATTLSWGVLRIGEWSTGHGCNEILVSACDNVLLISACGPMVLNSSGGGLWGGIFGALSDQADLQSALDGKDSVGTADAAIISHLAAEPHLPAPANAATLAKITEAAGLPLWDGGAWPGGGGGGGIADVLNVGTIGTQTLTADCSLYAGTIAAVSDNATITLAISGAPAGERVSHDIRLTCIGRVTIVYPEGWQWLDGSDLAMSGSIGLITLISLGDGEVVGYASAVSPSPLARYYWPLTAASWTGAVFEDQSPAASMPLSLYGQGSPAAPTWDSDGLLVLDGVDDWATQAQVAILNGVGWSVEALIKPTNTTQPYQIVLGDASSPNDPTPWMLQQRITDLRFDWRSDEGTVYALTAAGVLAAGVTRAVRIWRDDQRIRIAVDGTEVSSVIAPLTRSAVGYGLRVGSSRVVPYPWAGAIGQVTIVGGY